MSALWQVMLHRVLQQALQAEDAGQQQARTQDPRTMLNPSFCTVRGLYQAVEVPVQQVGQSLLKGSISANCSNVPA